MVGCIETSSRLFDWRIGLETRFPSGVSGPLPGPSQTNSNSETKSAIFDERVKEEVAKVLKRLYPCSFC